MLPPIPPIDDIAVEVEAGQAGRKTIEAKASDKAAAEPERQQPTLKARQRERTTMRESVEACLAGDARPREAYERFVATGDRPRPPDPAG